MTESLRDKTLCKTYKISRMQGGGLCSKWLHETGFRRYRKCAAIRKCAATVQLCIHCIRVWAVSVSYRKLSISCLCTANQLVNTLDYLLHIDYYGLLVAVQLLCIDYSCCALTI